MGAPGGPSAEGSRSLGGCALYPSGQGESAAANVKDIRNFNKSMVSLVLRQYMRGENGTEFSGVFFLSCLLE